MADILIENDSYKDEWSVPDSEFKPDANTSLTGAAYILGERVASNSIMTTALLAEIAGRHDINSHMVEYSQGDLPMVANVAAFQPVNAEFLYFFFGKETPNGSYSRDITYKETTDQDPTLTTHSQITSTKFAQIFGNMVKNIKWSLDDGGSVVSMTMMGRDWEITTDKPTSRSFPNNLGNVYHMVEYIKWNSVWIKHKSITLEGNKTPPTAYGDDGFLSSIFSNGAFDVTIAVNMDGVEEEILSDFIAGTPRELEFKVWADSTHYITVTASDAIVSQMTFGTVSGDYKQSNVYFKISNINIAANDGITGRG